MSVFGERQLRSNHNKMSQKKLADKLYVVVFLTGAIVMILELIGSRLLAPNLGTSTFVWASLIGVILGAMSAGYYYGGRVADNNPNWETLSRIIFISGVLVFLIIIFKQSILDLSAYFGIKTGAVLASLLLFAFPSFMLGMVSPYAVRLNIEKVESSGRTVGDLYAVSTFGSIVGTFAAGFYLIPHFGSVNILYGLAISLFAIGIFCHSGDKVYRIKIAVFLLCLLGFSIGAEAMDGGRYIYEKDSAYNHIRVSEMELGGRNVRVMSAGNFFDSGMYPGSDELVFEYTRYYALDEAFGGKIGRAAMFGGAAYSFPKYFLKNNTEGVLDVIEIDPETTEAAKRFFSLKEDPRMNIIHDDARMFLNDAVKDGKGTYDAIYNDAFSSACAMSSTLSTIEALREAYELLDEDGAYIVNTISSFEGEKSTFFRAEYKTISAVFDGVYAFYTKKGLGAEDVRNIMIVATKGKKDITEIKSAYLANGGKEEIAALMDNYWDKEVKVDDVELLTDDYSPVAYYASAACDAM